MVPLSRRDLEVIYAALKPRIKLLEGRNAGDDARWAEDTKGLLARVGKALRESREAS